VRRAAPAPTLRVDPAAAGPWAQVEAGPRGLRLAPSAAPAGPVVPGADLALVAGAPAGAEEVALAAGGRLALTVAAGVARSVRLPEVAVVHDRRPPGVGHVAGAPLANAGLLGGTQGWRAVVLPSLGDLAADLGPGPVALRPDGRRAAAVRNGAVEEVDLPGGLPATRVDPGDGLPLAMAYAADGRLLTAPPLGGAGAPVVALSAAAAALRVVALDEDGTVSLWDVDGRRLAAWPSPLPDTRSAALDAAGERVALAGPAAVAVARADDGALVRRIGGACAIALGSGADELVVGGEWGLARLAAAGAEP
jgi:hypothetical protein